MRRKRPTLASCDPTPGGVQQGADLRGRRPAHIEHLGFVDVSDSERLPLSRTRVVAAALELIDRDGVDALSMRKLGAALGVEAMSLYNHVGSKDDLLDGVADLLLELVELPASSPSWEDDVRALCRAVRVVGQLHPRAFPLLVTQTRTSFDSWAPILAGYRRLREAGATSTDAAQVVGTVSAYLVGAVLIELNGRAQGRDRGAVVRAEAVPADQPLLREYVAVRERTDFDADFDASIDLLITAVRSLLGSGAPPQPS